MLALVALCGSASCASPVAGARAETSGQYLVSREELAQRPTASVFDIISSVRPTWLLAPAGSTAAGGTGAATAEVYVNGRSVGPLELLRTIGSGEAEKVCYFRPTHAQNRFGTIAKRAVIEVFTRGSEYARRSC